MMNLKSSPIYSLPISFHTNLKVDLLYAVFDSIDSDHSGTLSYQKPAKTLLKSLSEEKARLLFKAMDFDKTGKVGLTAFTAASLEAVYNFQENENFLNEAFDLISPGEGSIKINLISKLLGRPIGKRISQKLIRKRTVKLIKKFLRLQIHAKKIR